MPGTFNELALYRTLFINLGLALIGLGIVTHGLYLKLRE